MPHTRFNITNDKICSTIIYRLQIFVIPAFQTFFCHQMAGIQFLFTANQIVSMSYCHENQSFITYRLFFQTKSDKIYSRIITIQHFHSYIAMHKNHVLHDCARISHFFRGLRSRKHFAEQHLLNSYVNCINKIILGQ